MNLLTPSLGLSVVALSLAAVVGIGTTNGVSFTNRSAAAQPTFTTPITNQTNTACPDVYEPVCAFDGEDYITYSNGCYASNAGADVECSSACPCGGNNAVPELGN